MTISWCTETNFRSHDQNFTRLYISTALLLVIFWSYWQVIVDQFDSNNNSIISGFWLMVRINGVMSFNHNSKFDLRRQPILNFYSSAGNSPAKFHVVGYFWWISNIIYLINFINHSWWEYLRLIEVHLKLVLKIAVVNDFVSTLVGIGIVFVNFRIFDKVKFFSLETTGNTQSRPLIIGNNFNTNCQRKAVIRIVSW